MEEKVSGIVLSSISYGENDKILKVFTLEKGVISTRIKGVKKAGAKLKFASEPFSFVEYVLRKGKAGFSVINASLIDSFYPLRENIFKYYAGATVLEFIKRFYQENIVSSQAFLLAINGLKNISYGENCLGLLAQFLICAIKESGFALLTEGCFNCGENAVKRMFFDYKSGAFYCQNCSNEDAREINPETFYTIQKLEKGESMEDIKSVKALKLIDYYLEGRMDERLNSLKELIKMFEQVKKSG